jgi:hypothetical protein
MLITHTTHHAHLSHPAPPMVKKEAGGNTKKGYESTPCKRPRTQRNEQSKIVDLIYMPVDAANTRNLDNKEEEKESLPPKPDICTQNEFNKKNNTTRIKTRQPHNNRQYKTRSLQSIIFTALTPTTKGTWVPLTALTEPLPCVTTSTLAHLSLPGTPLAPPRYIDKNSSLPLPHAPAPPNMLP